MAINFKAAPIPQNYVNQVDVYKKNYLDANASFPNGFQKDVIQNAMGARLKDTFENWSCDIYLEINKKGKFLIIEDSGTCGLTGKNRTFSEIVELMRNGEKLPGSERLSRFSSMNNSGDNKVGGGLYGIGKAVYSIASTTNTYYFDSLRDENPEYVANANINGFINEDGAFIDEQARDFIFEHTGLEPKKTKGTRIIIEDPDPEIIESIDSGEMEKFIQESWWMLMERFDENSRISLNHKNVPIPNYMDNIYRSQYVLIDTPYNVHGDKMFRATKFGFFIYETPEDCPFHGVSYYRRGMKIGEVELKEIPEKIKERFWGYVTMDEVWENAIAQYEDTVHFGISSYCKRYKEYKYLKDYICDIVLHEKFIDWGYIKDKKNEDRILNEELKEAARKAQELFDKLGFEDLGKGSNKSGFSIRWIKFEYPNKPKREVTTGDVIKAKFRIKSSYGTKRKFSYEIRVYSNDKEAKPTSITLKQNSISLDPGEAYDEELELLIDRNTAIYNCKNILSVRVDSGQLRIQETNNPFWYDADEIINSLEKIDLTGRCLYPHQDENSKRINYNESINDLTYSIVNKYAEELFYCLRVYVLYKDSAGQLREIESFEPIELHGLLPSGATIDTEPIKTIKFEENIFNKYVTDNKGVLVLRGRLSADKGNSRFERGERITKYDIDIYLNCDEKNGKENAFDTGLVDAPDNPKRSYIDNSINKILINSKHKEFLYMSEISDSARKRYMVNQVLTQYVYLYLEKMQYQFFDENGQKFSEMSPIEANQAIFSKVEKVIAESWE